MDLVAREAQWIALPTRDRRKSRYPDTEREVDLRSSRSSKGHPFAPDHLGVVCRDPVWRRSGPSRIRLVDQATGDPSFLVFVAIPNGGASAGTPDAPLWTHFDGVVAAAFNVRKLVRTAITDEAFLRGLRIEEAPAYTNMAGYTDVPDPYLYPDPALAPMPQDELLGPAYAHSDTINIDDRLIWRITLTPTQELLGSQLGRTAGGVLAIGLLMTGLVVSRLITSARCALALSELNERLQQAITSEELALREAAHFDAVTQKINSGWSLHQILDYIYESFVPLLPYDRIAFAVLEKDGREVHSVWSRSRGHPGNIPHDYKTSLEGSSLQDLLRNGQPRVLDDLRDFLQSHPYSRTTRLPIENSWRASWPANCATC